LQRHAGIVATDEGRLTSARLTDAIDRTVGGDEPWRAFPTTIRISSPR